MRGKNHYNWLEVSHSEGNARSESAKNVDDWAQIPKHMRRHRDLNRQQHLIHDKTEAI